MHITNNSNIIARNIGQTFDNPNGALQCITDNIRCCLSQNPRLGEWYLPNRELVQGSNSNKVFYRTRGDNGEVSLNRPSGVESPTGLFCCEVPDATSTNQTLCVNIGKHLINRCMLSENKINIMSPICSQLQRRIIHYGLWALSCW